MEAREVASPDRELGARAWDGKGRFVLGEPGANVSKGLDGGAKRMSPRRASVQSLSRAVNSEPQSEVSGKVSGPGGSGPGSSESRAEPKERSQMEK